MSWKTEHTYNKYYYTKGLAMDTPPNVPQVYSRLKLDTSLTPPVDPLYVYVVVDGSEFYDSQADIVKGWNRSGPGYVGYERRVYGHVEGRVFYMEEFYPNGFIACVTLAEARRLKMQLSPKYKSKIVRVGYMNIMAAGLCRGIPAVVVDKVYIPK